MKVLFVLLLFLIPTTATEYDTAFKLFLEKKDSTPFPPTFYRNLKYRRSLLDCYTDSELEGEDYLKWLKHDPTFLLLPKKDFNPDEEENYHEDGSYFEEHNGKKYRVFSTGVSAMENARCALLLTEECEREPDFYSLVLLKCWVAYIYDYKLDT